MYRTDKQFMKNPATAPSRIYVGNLSEMVVPQAMEEKFSAHGKILGLVLSRGFGFIQFENEQQAQSAIQNEHGTMFFSRKLNVKQAIDNAKAKQNHPPANNFNNSNNFQQNQNNFQENPNNFQQNNFQQQNKFQENQNQPPPLIQMNQQSPPNITEKPPLLKQEPLKPSAQSPVKPPPPQISNVNQQPPLKKMPENVPPPLMQDDGSNDKRKRKPRGKRDFRDRDVRDERDYPTDPIYYEPPPPTYPPYPVPVIERPERNDCEIIVVSKALTEYAEYIEDRLKALGLIVDLLFPNEDVPIGRVLANISSRGCLYAILVMPQNEEYRSLTLNILHGIPEEHRNMPLEDAFILLTRNFEQYMRGEKFEGETDKVTLTSRHPEHIQVILNLLAENRQVVSQQYDRLIIYMQEKRDLQAQFEISEGIVSESETKNKQAELQSRIMNILNKKEDTKVNENSSGPTPLLNDPSVQKALDSLLIGDMFKGLTS